MVYENEGFQCGEVSSGILNRFNIGRSVDTDTNWVEQNLAFLLSQLSESGFKHNFLVVK